LRAPDVLERLNAAGGDAGGMSPEAFRKFILDDAARWKDIVVRSGAKLD
jgi:tripartite-type tricarboxylate transporter receptor subunit TctC